MGIMYDIVSGLLVKEMDKSEKSGYTDDIVKQVGKINAITKMAKDSIMSYPVLFSESIVASDENLVFSISKYLEAQYAMLTVIAMGLEPVIGDSKTRNHIMRFYSEENEEFVKDENDECIISESKEKVCVKESYLIEYNTSKESFESTISRNLRALEKRARESDPTLINAKFKTSAGSDSTVEIPLAIKTMPRFLTSEESKRIFSYLREDKPIVNIVRLLSGEIQLFRDIIFQLERAKKDKELYAKLGRHPWFRKLINRRTNRRINGILGLIPVLKKFIKHENDILPICSLVVTKDEIESGFEDLWVRIKKSDENIMDKLMLLCLCVVDTTTSIIEFDFYGLKNNTIVRADTLNRELGGGSKDKDFTKLLQTLIYKI